MISFGRAFHAELLKLKRTLAFRMIFVAPVLVALLGFFIQSNQASRGAGPTAQTLWNSLFRDSFAVWAIFLLPLLITLETALLAGIEHGEKQWKHLFALPIPRASIYAAKYAVAQGLAVASTLLVCVMLVLTGYALMPLFPALAAAGPPPPGLMLRRALSCWSAAGLLLAMQLWISLRWPSFTVALASGVSGTFFALFAASAKVGEYYPWLLPVNSINEKLPERVGTALWLGIGGGVLVAIAGCLDFVRREESAPPALSRKALAAWIVAAGFFVWFAIHLQKDRPAKLTGRIEREDKVSAGYTSHPPGAGADPRSRQAAERAFQAPTLLRPRA